MSPPTISWPTLFARTVGALKGGRDEVDDDRTLAGTVFRGGSRPSMQQMQRWLRDGKLPGRKVGGTWFIDEHEWLADGDDLVLRVLSSS